MKKILIIFLTTAIFITGCSKEALDTQPNDRYTEATFWTTEQNASAGLIGCYAILRQDGIFGVTTPLLEESATPNAYNYDNSIGFNVIANGTQTANNSSVITQRYGDAYSGIGRCNTLLAKIDGISMNEDLKERMKAEAKFLRALYYSLLSMYYGGVPLILDPPAMEQAQLPRNNRLEVVQQILKDLDEAADVLPVNYTGGDVGRATQGAALALKARVLLFEASPLNNPSGDVQKWKDAADAAKAVMDLPATGYGLYPNYRALFYAANDNSQESIFDVQFKSPELGSSFDVVGAQSNTNAPVKGLIEAYDMKDGLPQSQSPLYNSAKPYENRDPRMYQTIVYPGDTFRGGVTTVTSPFKVTGYAIKKYTMFDKEANNAVITGGRSDINYMVIRYADVLLMYAEAQNEVLNAPDGLVYSSINEVRLRAGLNPYEIPTGKTKAQMRELIRHERRIEFAGEGLYYTDIRRWRTAELVLNATIHDSQNQVITTRNFNSARDYWWPIPLTERELNNNLEQNPNY